MFNAATGKHKVPKKLREGEYYPSTKDRPRCYERFSRAIIYVPRIAPFRSNIDNIDPNQRMFQSEHTGHATRFAATLLSAVDLVWFPEKDYASKLDYADWAGSIDELPPPAIGIHPTSTTSSRGTTSSSTPAS